MKWKIIFLICALICLSQLVSAEDVFMIGDSVDYKFPCYNNGTFCSGSATCNITVLDNDFQTIVNGRAATPSGTYFNYSIHPNFLTKEGRYNVIYSCTDGGFSNSNNDFFIMSRRSFIYDNSLGFLSTIKFFIIFTYLLLIYGFFHMAKYRDDLGGLLIALASMFMMVIGLDVFINGMDNMVTLYTQTFGMMNILVGGLLLFMWGYEKYKDIF